MVKILLSPEAIITALNSVVRCPYSKLSKYGKKEYDAVALAQAKAIYQWVEKNSHLARRDVGVIGEPDNWYRWIDESVWQELLGEIEAAEKPPCPTCGGSGWKSLSNLDKLLDIKVANPCPTCNGTGVKPEGK